MKKILAMILCAVMICAVFSGCGKTASEEAAKPAAAETTAGAKVLKIGTLASNTHPIGVTLEHFKEEVEAKSNGSITVDLYLNGVLSSGENELCQQVEMGACDAAVIMGFGCFQGEYPACAVDEIPFLFTSAEKARAAYDGEFGDLMAELFIEPSGLHLINYWESGFRHFTNNVRPFVTPADFEGLKMRSAETTYRIKMFETLGCAAIPIPGGEMYTALQQGTVDGQENPLPSIVSNGIHEVNHYISLSGHIYNTAFFIINNAKWDTFTAEEQALLQEIANECREMDRELSTQAEQDAIKTAKDFGCEVNEVDKEAFVECLKAEWDFYIEQNGEDGQKLIEVAQKYA